MKITFLVAFWCLLSIGKVAGQEVVYKITPVQGDSSSTRFWLGFEESPTGALWHFLDTELAMEKDFLDYHWSPVRERFYIHTHKPKTLPTLSRWMDEKLEKRKISGEGANR